MKKATIKIDKIFTTKKIVNIPLPVSYALPIFNQGKSLTGCKAFFCFSTIERFRFVSFSSLIGAFQVYLVWSVQSCQHMYVPACITYVCTSYMRLQIFKCYHTGLGMLLVMLRSAWESDGGILTSFECLCRFSLVYNSEQTDSICCGYSEGIFSQCHIGDNRRQTSKIEFLLLLA